MHGSLRLVLSIFVACSHLGHGVGFNLGMSSVIIFYLLSGYVVSRLLQKHFPNGRLFAFYGERFLRIYPVYLFFFLVASLFVLTTSYGPPKFDAWKTIANLTIIPLNYYMVYDVSIVRSFALLPPAWSLALELQVYLILPYVLRSVTRKWIVGSVSLGIFMAAMFRLIDQELWSYRLLPGVMFVFLTGAAISSTLDKNSSSDSFDRNFPKIAWGCLLLVSVVIITTAGRLYLPFAVVFGFLTGVPIVHFSSKIRTKLKFDNLLGKLSYGLFLIHMPVSWSYEVFFDGKISDFFALIYVLIVSVLLAMISSSFIEPIVWKFRLSLSDNTTVAKTSPHA
jgi:peptidoglycan/LPS O-acetylase OafA/YrhL